MMVLAILLSLTVGGAALCQSTPPVVPTAPQAPATVDHGEAVSRAVVTHLPSDPMEPTLHPTLGVIVDQVVAIVNGDVLLESDVDAERRFEQFQPFTTQGPFSRDRAVGRLIDQTLILQQEKLQPGDPIPEDEVQRQFTALRRDLPDCKSLCTTDKGWNEFVLQRGFSTAEFERRWRQRMLILRFIEQRFRAGIEVSPAEIKTYYEHTMLPEYTRRNASAPKLEAIAPRVQEVLLEQKVNGLLEDWLKALKAEGAVRMMHPGEVLP
jgi:hypothetical protein